MRDALAAVTGTWGLAVVHADFPDRIVAARNGSPLLVGVGDKEMYVASDLAAIVRHTTTVAHLEDGELATVTAAGFTTFRDDLTRTTREATTLDLDPDGLRGGRPRVVHAQGDARAARRRPPGGQRPARQAVRDRPPRRPQHRRPRDPRDQAGQGARLRLGVLRRPDGCAARRGARADPRRRRGRERVPLPRPGDRARHALRRGQPVGRDHRHPARRAGGTTQGRALHRPGQRRRQRDRPRVRRRPLPARRARRWRWPRPRR